MREQKKQQVPNKRFSAMASFDKLSDFNLDNIEVTQVKVGSGAYGTVTMFEYMGLKCAGKQIHPILLNEGKETCVYRKYVEECHLLSKIHHPNIVQFLGVFSPKNKTSEENEAPYLVMELLQTDLWSCIKNNGILPNEIIYSILHDVALGLYYLHSQTPSIIHRDLSSRNVLLTSSMTAKIADLGVARRMSNLTPIHLRQLTQAPGNATFMPPEVMVEHPKYNTSVDIFSYGVIMIHLFSGKCPNESDKHREVELFNLVKISINGKYYEQFLREIGKKHPFKNLIEKCINSTPEKRASIQEIVKHTSEMTSRFQFCAIGPKEMMMHDTDILIKQRQEKQLKIREKHEQHMQEMEILQKECEELKIPLTTKKQVHFVYKFL